MKHRKSTGTELHYYSDRLKRKLEALRSVPATVVEAPSGYGKTTAIRDFFGVGFPRNVPVYWFTAVDETPAAGFQRFCREIHKIDDRAEARLARIGLPNAASAGEAADALRSMECNDETYLVIDNFQFLPSELPTSFFNALLEHGGKGLHIIILTQMLRRNLLASVSGHGVLHITAADLRLGTEDIVRYYALAGVKISREQVQRVAYHTGGWIIAVYLQMRALRETGSLSDSAGIFNLMEHLVWDTLTDDQQTFLMRISPFELVTVKQACALADCKKLPEYALEALGNPFVRYEHSLRRYELHSILSELLVCKRKERGAKFEQECLLRAGELCCKDGRTSEALGFYWQIRDYERMLSLDVSRIMLEKIGKRPFWELALDIAHNCPYEIRKSNVLSVLRLAWALLLAGKDLVFDALMEELRAMLEETGAKTTPLYGEWLLLSSWRRLPRLEEMTDRLKRAAPLFYGTCSQVILPSAPWCYGNYSQIAAFHSRPGEADREAEALEKYISLYSGLTGGHGSGADILFRAELAHYRGDLNRAEILAYKAASMAEKKQQSVVQLGAALHLAEIAVEKSDVAGWQNAMNFMDRAASCQRQNNFVLRSAIDILRAVLLNELQYQRRIADWLKTGETAGKLLPDVRLNAVFVQLCYFMQEGEYARLAGMAEAEREELCPDAVLADTLISLLAAIGHISLGDTIRAWELLEHAAERALPDGFVYLFAVYYWMLQGLPEKLVRERYPEQLARFVQIKERFLSGFLALRSTLSADGLPGDLTAREREVALLAAEGLRNSEIAKKLTVSENTVRFHLRAIFQKLDIDRRAKLAEKLK